MILKQALQWRGVAFAAGLMFSSLASPCLGQPKEFAKWPAGKSPQDVGKRVAERFVSTVKLSETEANYPAICAWYGALSVSQRIGDQDLSARLIRRFDEEFTPAVSRTTFQKRHVDYSVAGAVPLEIYIETKEPRYLDFGRRIADQQFDKPAPDGLSGETRFWIDDMFMITFLQVQAFRATGDAKYLDRAALEMEAYLDKLQQPNGLFYHAPDVPIFWGRGNGWVAAGMTELLRSLPENHPRRVRIMKSYRLMMQSLLKFQRKDGMWLQVIDHREAWAETSSTAMFTYAMIAGVKNGWLDRKYAKAARKGWLGVVGYLDAHADLRSVCEGTGKNNDLNYYFQRARLTGDLHGQAPLLWSAAALLR